MKKRVVAALLVALTASTAWSAPWDGRRGAPDRERPPQREQAPGQWRSPPPDRHAERFDRRDGALSEEERRGLHRDLDRANRELYRRR